MKKLVSITFFALFISFLLFSTIGNMVVNSDGEPVSKKELVESIIRHYKEQPGLSEKEEAMLVIEGLKSKYKPLQKLNYMTEKFPGQDVAWPEEKLAYVRNVKGALWMLVATGGEREKTEQDIISAFCVNVWEMLSGETKRTKR